MTPSIPIPATGYVESGRRGAAARAGGRFRFLPFQSAWRGRESDPGAARSRLLVARQKLIRVTIAERALEVHFQPIVNLQSGGVVGVEALARFALPPVRPPDEWFLEAASLGLGVDLEVTALGLALEQLCRLPAELYMTLNVSAEAIMSDRLREILAGVPAERVVLELTERIPVDDYPAMMENLEGLRSSGVRLAVDDAGAGIASLRHVLDLRPEIIKLDIGLIRGIDTDPARQALAVALVSFARETHQAAIVAEGIETEGELEVLRQLGCPLGQGFLLGRPERLTVDLPVDAIGAVDAVHDLVRRG